MGTRDLRNLSGFLVGLGLGALLAGAAPADGRPPDRFDTVVIDAGHGGEDEGAVGPVGLLEKQLVLDLAHRLERRLVAMGLRVVQTRAEDVFVPLERRMSLANDADGDLFVSIHANASTNASARGVETYFLSAEATDAAADDLARRENASFGEAALPANLADDPLLALLGDMIATEHLAESSDFAREALGRLAALAEAPSRGVKQAPFVVLMGVQMPAALLEVGFITHREEERLLGTSSRRDAIVDALVKAVSSFGQRYDSKHGVAAEDSLLGGGE